MDDAADAPPNTPLARDGVMREHDGAHMPVESSSGSGLGEDVGLVQVGVDLGNTYDATLMSLTNVVESDVNVLGALVVHRVLYEVDRALVVLKNRSRTDGRAVHVVGQLAEVADLGAHGGQSDVLALGAGQGDDRLQPT